MDNLGELDHFTLLQNTIIIIMEKHHPPEDDDGPSSAALCIKFTIDYEDHVNKPVVFHPVFTHQIFPGERIPGFRPYRSMIGQPKDKAHSSVHDASATRELLIEITMLPSSKVCAIAIYTQPIDHHRNTLSSSPSDVTSLMLSEKPESLVKKRMKRADDLDAVDYDGGSWSIDQIVQRLRTHLPPVTNVHIFHLASHIPSSPLYERPVYKRFGKRIPFLRRPVGKVIKEYGQDDGSFVISLCDGPKAAAYHSAVQKWATYFIETAQDVNIDDPNWKVLYLFRHHHCYGPEDDPQEYSLVGYMTLYFFENPFRKPLPGTIVRICQAVILPHHQRKGHGAKMYHAIYERVVPSCDRYIVEVNVEDPAPAFSYLRLLVDYERFLRCEPSWFRQDGTPNYDFINRRTPTTLQQIQLVYEVNQLDQLLRKEHGLNYSVKYSPLTQCGEGWKAYRLGIKRRLLQQHREELPDDTEERKQRLEEMYQEVLQLYHKVLRKADVSRASRFF